MKKLHLLFAFFLFFLLLPSMLLANVTVTAATGGTLLPRYTAENGNVTAYTTLGNIVIDENSNNDFNQSDRNDKTLILTAPANWHFNPGTGSVSRLSGGDISSTNLTITVTSTTITVTYHLTNFDGSYTNDDDRLTISGIQVRAIDGNITNEQYIYRTGGTGTITGITNNVTNFGSLSLDPATPLPVELTSFAASVKNYAVHLNWETATEVSNYGFEVERSADKINWTKVAFVNGHGNSNSPKQYSYTDSKISSGKYYYRLKQIDADGAFAYSKEVEVSTGVLLNDFVVEQNFPNPFNPTTTIKFGFKEPVSAKVIIYNALGSEVTTLFNEQTEAGKVYSIDFDGSQLASGIYYYSVSGGNYNSVKKMILMK